MHALIVAILLSSQIPADADPKDSGLAELLRAMKADEARYKNLDLEYRQTTTLVLDESKVKGKRSYRTSDKTNHTVTQGDLYRGDFVDKLVYLDDSKETLTTITGYDGKTTRTNVQNSLGNIEHARVPTMRWLTPHRMGFLQLPEDFLLADWIGFTSVVKSHPRYGTYRASTKLLGTETVGGVACRKIEMTLTRPGMKTPSGRYVYWVAPSRSYLPLRARTYNVTLDDEIPECEYEVDHLRETAPGLWSPWTASIVQNWSFDLQKGVRTPYTRTTVNVKTLKLDPKYPIEYFRAVEMPKNGPTHIIKDKKIVDAPPIRT